MKTLLSVMIGAIITWFLLDSTSGVPFYIVSSLQTNSFIVTDNVYREERTRVGSSVWLDEWTLLTNCHVAEYFFRQRKEEGKPMESYYDSVTLVSYDGSKIFKGDILACDEDKDLALIKSHWPNHGAGVDVDWRTPRFGSKLYSAGFHHNMSMSIKEGLTGMIEVATEHTRLTVTMPISQGDSGSPVLNTRGQLVALIVATRGVRTMKGMVVQQSDIALTIPGISIHTFLQENGYE